MSSTPKGIDLDQMTAPLPTLPGLIPARESSGEAPEPACLGDGRFTDDTAHQSRTEASDRELAAICARCPLLAACNAYAVEHKPTAGFWAGRWYVLRERRGASEVAQTGPNFLSQQAGKVEK